jgi:hypothetical protein
VGLAIDRTNWDFGRTTINILMISVIFNRAGVAVIWTLGRLKSGMRRLASGIQRRRGRGARDEKKLPN